MSFIDRLTSRGFQEMFAIGVFLTLALLAFACTVANGQDAPLNVSAIAGRNATVEQLPPLNCTAIAKSSQRCTCPGCTCDHPHQCGDPGCTCAVRQQAGPPLDLAAISPQRKAAQVKPVEKPKTTAAVKQPHYELRNVCNGGYCTRQWVLVQ